MVKRVLFSLLMILSVISASAQRITVSGRVVESSGEPIDQATVQILQLPDSTYVNGCVSNPNGYFTLPAVKAGKYVVKFSFVGFRTKVQAVTLTTSKTQVNVGTIKLDEDAVLLKEAVVTAQAAQVEVKEDTVQYNVSAYRVPEGSALEELVKKIPGAEVSEDGKITLNGKDISKILVNGKEFFSGDTQVAMKNLTVDMVDKIKAYDKKSDLARVTGIDDGEEEAVIDLTMKKGQNQGTFANITGGIGTKGRWQGQGNVNRFSDSYQYSVMANLNNTNDMGFPGGGGGFRMGGGNGVTKRQTLGANFAMENKKIEMGGNIRYSYSDSFSASKSSNHNFQSGLFGNSTSSRENKNKSVNFDYRLEWKPTTHDNLIFRPRASYSEGEGSNTSLSTSVATNPGEDQSLWNSIQSFLKDAKVDVFSALSDAQKLALRNAQNSSSLSGSNSKNVSGELQYNHKFGDNGRNLTVRATAGYTHGESDSYTNNDQWLFQTNMDNMIRRYTNTPTKNYNYSTRLTYSEPIFTGGFLQFSYQFNHRYSKNDQNIYDLSNLLSSNSVIGTLPVGYEQYRDGDLSKMVENKFDDQNLGMTLRVNRSKWQLNAGATWRPQHTQTFYEQYGSMGEFSHNYYNLAPSIDYRYNFNKQTRLRLQWRNNASQPSINNMIPVVNNSNPLSISGGNPELEPSYSNNISLMFNTFLIDTQTSFMTNLSYRNTSNNVSNVVVYDNVTGASVSMPKNIDGGNWNTMGMFVFNTALKDKRFTIGSFSNVSFNNMSSYYNDRDNKVQGEIVLDKGFDEFFKSFKNLEKNGGFIMNQTKNLSLSERLNFAFRTDLFDIGLNGSIQFSDAKNKLQPTANMKTYNFSYGINGNINLPWNMQISTDLTNSSRRGYSDASFNTNELIWNAQIAQSLFKRKATLTLQFYDILQNQSNISRSITAAMQSDSENYAINSYAMLKFTYRLNIMGSKDMRDRMRGMGGPGGFGGPGMGGFGGGRGGFGGGGRGGFGRPE